MARLEVRWTGEAQAEIAEELEGLGLQEVEAGFFVAEGEGRTLIKVVGAIGELRKAARHAGSGEVLNVNFQDPGSTTA
jgi:isopropylmalate/homocitrate/citramalate synthase